MGALESDDISCFVAVGSSSQWGDVFEYMAAIQRQQ
jgi:hypothetical protein